MNIDTATQWVKDNPWMAGGIAVGATAIIALAVSPQARKAVGLGKAPVKRNTRSKTAKRISVKRLK